ncbi:GNAT family N-acetyltransferase [Vulcanibacillus modesticaldus]|uniref:GNAT family N-acetyltransferase n=1 Tax=Vulcanibacillus modesticaldus TaxID=337097 RepID=A0A1D2YUB6_9BACI|nr:N-acetyltransferase [Vulcanibacillus modesticaldus]OEF99302.1 GNAT family N-acetyltransferase [Vulcanibacillus modesticaldus]
MSKVVPLKINYKTIEDFKKFREYGLEELSMLEDLEANMIEDGANSPFFGVYDDEKLVGRMSLYKVEAKYDKYFDPPEGYYELFKLEVLPEYRGKRIGSMLVKYAKSLGHPIKTNARNGSRNFWLKMGFSPVKYDPIRDRGENPYIWHPDGF